MRTSDSSISTASYYVNITNESAASARAIVLADCVRIVAANMAAALNEMSDFWLLRLLLILFGYSSVLLPGYLIVRLVRRKWQGNSARAHFEA